MINLSNLLILIKIAFILTKTNSNITYTKKKELLLISKNNYHWKLVLNIHLATLGDRVWLYTSCDSL
jgi:hypothetical protein